MGSFANGLSSLTCLLTGRQIRFEKNSRILFTTTSHDPLHPLVSMQTLSKVCLNLKRTKNNRCKVGVLTLNLENDTGLVN